MGFGSNGIKTIYTVDGIKRDDVVDIGNHLMRKSNAEVPSSARPKIVVDANNLIHKVGRKSMNPVNEVANHLIAWAQQGFIMIPVCDGDTRPISKQQSNKNYAKIVKSKHDAVINRQKLRDINKQLESCGSESERNEMKKTRSKMERKIKSAETQSKNVVPSNFADLLQAELDKVSAGTPGSIGGGYVSTVKTAEFQADSLMCGIYLSGQCQLIQSADADFVMFLGDECVTIKDCKGEKLTLSSTSKQTLDDVISCLKEESQSKVEWKVPPHPVFEGITDMKTRALIAVIIGCDVCPGGVDGIGPKVVDDKLKEMKEKNKNEDTGSNNVSVYDELMKWAVEKSKPRKNEDPQFNEEVLTTFVNAIIYEPTNELGTDNRFVDNRTYMKDVPTHLPQYLSEFKSSSTTIEKGPDILQCKGACCNSSHPFLAAVTHHTCPVCKDIVCGLCTMLWMSGVNH